MRLHILSDLHLEQGPYRIPSDLEFDVLVVAGDISSDPAQAVDWMLSVGKPVVAVLGNHDYWSAGARVDFQARLAEFQRLTKATDAHILEQESVQIGTTRFLGTTLWTDYGSHAQRKKVQTPNRHLLLTALYCMADYYSVGAQEWLAVPENKEWFNTHLAALDLPEPHEDRFHPLLAWQWHQRAVAWLREQLDPLRPAASAPKPTWTHTVVVTHHAPTYAGMVRAGLMQPQAADSRFWVETCHRPDRDYLGLYRAAAYGSNTLGALMHRAKPDLWIHGHTHARMDLVQRGMRIVCNPRGYPHPPVDETTALFLGIRQSPEEQQRRQAEYAANPNPGDGEHDERLVLDLENQVPMDAVRPELQRLAARVAELLADAEAFAARLADPDPLVARAMCELTCSRFTTIHDETKLLLDRTFDDFNRALPKSLQGLPRPFGIAHEELQPAKAKEQLGYARALLAKLLSA